MPNLPNYRLFPTTFVATIAITSNAGVAATTDAVRRAFADLGITPGKSATDSEPGRESRTLAGRTEARDITVKIASTGTSSRVSVTVRHDDILWDKPFARTILNRILSP